MVKRSKVIFSLHKIPECNLSKTWPKQLSISKRATWHTHFICSLTIRLRKQWVTDIGVRSKTRPHRSITSEESRTSADEKTGRTFKGGSSALSWAFRFDRPQGNKSVAHEEAASLCVYNEIIAQGHNLSVSSATLVVICGAAFGSCYSTKSPLAPHTKGLIHLIRVRLRVGTEPPARGRGGGG